METGKQYDQEFTHRLLGACTVYMYNDRLTCKLNSLGGAKATVMLHPSA